MLRPPSGECGKCGLANAYSKFTCDRCGVRLAWAAELAGELGERCPACGRFNPYANPTCAGCDQELPWSQCAAARMTVRGRAEDDQKSLGWTMLGLVLTFLVMMGHLIASLPFKP